MMRREAKDAKQSPWEALSVSRATWYRFGKPDKPRQKKRTRKEELPGIAAAGLANSVRTWQRRERVLASPLMPYVMTGHLSFSQADKILATPGGVERFEKRLRATGTRTS